MVINIAKEFTPFPGPRYSNQGEGSGEEFRRTLLRPRFDDARRAGEKLYVELDGVTFGYPTSFLEEAFGGLAREVGIETVQRTLELISSSEPLLEEEIMRYIQDAKGG